MKKQAAIILTAVVIAAALAAGARALTVKRLEEKAPKPVKLTGTVFEGDPVVNYNLTVPAASLEGGPFCFGVKDASDFCMLSATGDGFAVERVTGGIPARIAEVRGGGGEVVLMVRGPLCGIRTDGGFRAFFVENESIPPRWAWMGEKKGKAAFRPLAAVLFADSFMRMKADEGEWRPLSGDWKIVSLPNPSRSANAFRLAGTAGKEEAFDLLDLPDWDNYRAEVNVRPLSGGAAGGMVFDWRGGDDYNAVLLEAGEKGGSVRVTARRNGKEEVLGTFEGGFFPGQWYNLVIEQTFGRLVLEVNGVKALDISSPRFSSGKFGLTVRPGGNMQFDDLDVRPLTPTETAGLVSPEGAWHLFGPVEMKGGAFRFGSATEGFAFLPLKLGEGSVVEGELSWKAGSRGMLMLGGMAPGEKSAFLVAAGRLAAPEELMESPAARRNGEASFKVSVVRGSALLSLEGDAVFHGIIPLREGMLSLGLAGSGGFSCAGVKVESAGRTRVVLWRNEIFTHESTMRNWNDDGLHWKRVRAESSRTFAYVNDRICSRNLEATLKLTDQQAAAEKFEAAVALPFEAGELDSGYELHARTADGRCEVSLKLKGETLWSGEVEDLPLRTLTIYRRGRFVLSFVNGRYFRGYVSPDELPLSMVGCLASPFVPKLGDVEISSDSIYEYLFNTAPSDWKVGAGVWEVLNRWQCDPRWSWFSGDSTRDARGKVTDPLALLWWRRHVKGDFTFEMYFGFKMDRARGAKYSYARDVDLALVSDTADMDSGYQFIVGGAKGKKINAVSRVLRNGEAIPWRDGTTSTESPYRLFTSQSHRFWFHYLLKRRGGRFTLEFTDQKGTHTVFDFTDPDPLDADRLGIWSYDCGLMLARIRIQTTGYAPPVDPREEKNVRPRTIYDLEEM